MSNHPTCSKGVLVLTVGLPGSGKTSLCKKLSCALQANSWKVFSVCYDEIIIDGRQNWNSADFLWRIERTKLVNCVDKLIERLRGNMEDSQLDEDEIAKRFEQVVTGSSLSTNNKEDAINFLILIDDNMYYRSMRYVFWRLARQHQLGFLQLYVKCSVQTAIARNSFRNEFQQIPENVVRNMHDRLEPPDGSKNEWENLTVIVETDINSEPFSDERFREILEERLDNPCPPLPDIELMQIEKAKNRQETLESDIHQADLCIRKFVGEIMKHSKSSKDIKKTSKKLRDAKDVILAKLRSMTLDSTIARNPEELRRLFFDLVKECEESSPED